MLKNLLAAGLSTVLLLSVAPDVFGHGGQYRGPGDTVPPNLGGGGDTAPPGNPGGPGSPGPGAPAPGRGRSAAASGAPAAPTAANAAAGRVTTASLGFVRRSRAEGFERWEFWWEHNKEPFLNLKARLDNSAVMTGSVGFFTGRGKRNEALSTNRPSAEDVKQRIIPKLIPLMGEKHPDVVDSSVLAVGRMLRVDDAAEALQPLINTLGHDAQTGRESATLSLGVLGSSEAIEVLKHLMLDTREGRRLTNKPAEVEDVVRAFAAASLGMIGDSSVVDDFKSVLNDDRLKSKRDLRAMALLSIGLMRDRHEEIVPFLLKCMTDRNLDRIVRAQAPIALGKLKELNPESTVATAALGEAVNVFLDDKTDLHLKRSLAVCLGMLATVQDTQAVDALMNAVAQDNDDQVRHFSIMALAQIGAQDEEPDKNAETHSKLEAFFMRELSRPKRITHQPYGSLGLAVYARNENLQGTKARAIGKIMEAFKKTNNPSFKGAMAVGLGLLNAEEASELLWEEFEDSNDQPLKGYIALSLGLTRQVSKGDTFRTLIQKKGLDFKFRLQLARALGLMGDAEAVSTLVKYLQESGTLNETSSAAQALGLIGDKSAIDPLIAIVENKTKNPLQRGFACVALGIIAEKADLPWNVVFSVNSNYRAKVPALSEILDIL